MSSVGIVVVTSDSAYCVEKCLASIQRRDAVEIVVVDNDSQDGTPAIVSRYKDVVQVLQRQGRHSLSNNINVALALMTSEYVLILNPDIILPSGAVESMARFLDINPKSGACAPALKFPDGQLQLSCRRFPTLKSFFLRRTPLRLLLSDAKRDSDHLMANVDHTRVQEVDWLLGACIMFRRAALHSIGYFDDGYRLYCEDIDVCYRLWAKGWTVDYNPEIRVVHEHRAVSDKRLLSKHSLWHYRSMFRYVRKHGLFKARRPSPIAQVENASSQESLG